MMSAETKPKKELITQQQYIQLKLEEKNKWKALSADLKKQIIHLKNSKSDAIDLNLFSEEEREFFLQPPKYNELFEKLILLKNRQTECNKALPTIETLLLDVLSEVEINYDKIKQLLIETDNDSLLIES